MLFIVMQTDEGCGEVTLAVDQLRSATAGDLPKVKSFLRENGLHDVGVEGCVRNFVIIEDEIGSWIGVAGLETHGNNGLLRSVAVRKHSRGKGVGRALVNAVLADAGARGLTNVYLLTNDASDYFEQLGFRIVDRKDVDASIKTSVEFTVVCPDSAVVMRKTIG
jgi:amino-acid N-acetyltransferase